MKKPFLYTGSDPIFIDTDMAFEIVKTIMGNGDEDAFKTACKEKNISLQVGPELVNLVKLQLFAKRRERRSAFADGIVRSATCPRDG
jgi:hypothetical protein